MKRNSALDRRNHSSGYSRPSSANHFNYTIKEVIHGMNRDLDVVSQKEENLEKDEFAEDIY